jgi:hypothetical protein
MSRAHAAYDGLLERAEEIDDEWSYVNDLATAWRTRLDAVEASRGGEPVSAEVDAAVSSLIDEAGAIDDPHRAIDWLSTFPLVLLSALGERP